MSNTELKQTLNTQRVIIGTDQQYFVEQNFYQFVNAVISKTTQSESSFWSGVADLLDTFIPKNKALLSKRDELQTQIDAWHTQHRDQLHDAEAYRQFLTDIGYLLPEPSNFTIDTENVDDEIACIAGPQLVVPVKNARFALNAANARWGSLYDALYGTDVISREGNLAPGVQFNVTRGAAVIAYAKTFLDKVFPLKTGSHSEVVSYQINNQTLAATLANGSETTLKDTAQFVASSSADDQLSSIVLLNNRLHIELLIDRTGAIGKDDPAGLQDIMVEAAITTIMDCEDSVAAVDAEDKIEVYTNWLGLIEGDLQESFVKSGKTITRALNKNRQLTAADGGSYTVYARSLMLVRNVGLLTTIDAIVDGQGNWVPEGLLDAIVTCLISSIDVNQVRDNGNSRQKSIYIVKPKMHGPEEVQFSCDLFAQVETLLDLPLNTVKLGIMDEERRTTVNLAQCLKAARDRVIFINTGFLDRTGDEIHTSMEAGPFLPKGEIKQQVWIDAYENQNVDIGLKHGSQGTAQIGKGMWAMPDKMAQMMVEKIGHPQAGANTAWVPSPIAACLHVLHYHYVNVADVQQSLLQRAQADVNDILTIPLLPANRQLTQQEIENELENNIQGILGYVVRWIDQGVGCSKVPDIHNVGLMEDRATLRISSQLLANWLHHGICTEGQINQALIKMAAVVDQQNSDDSSYRQLITGSDDLAFTAAKALIFQGRQQPSGYTEPLLHKYRLQFKQSL